ncbi:hypothetical protein [Enterococcus faecium]|uniref:hypothetical protein n=1 Tax=Enterococcus faecium TaxID=1352 RepID=UPI000BEF650B|nr:hypothetical protein [Enterococcus faecium]PEH49324.1 hypothetical protein CRM75_16230 [Enterococcus faecium]
MDTLNAIVAFIEKFNTLIGFLSFVVSCFTLFFSIRIKSKVENAKDEQILNINSDKIIGELRAYSIFIDKNQTDNIDRHSLQSYLIELEETYPLLKKKKKKIFKLLYSSLKDGQWLSVKRGISHLIAYIERI